MKYIITEKGDNVENRDKLFQEKIYPSNHYVRLRNGYDALLFELRTGEKVCAKITNNPKQRLFTSIKIGKIKNSVDLFIEIDNWCSTNMISKIYSDIDLSFLSFMINRYIEELNKPYVSSSMNFQIFLQALEYYKYYDSYVSESYLECLCDIKHNLVVENFINCYFELVYKLQDTIQKLIRNQIQTSSRIGFFGQEIPFVDFTSKDMHTLFLKEQEWSDRKFLEWQKRLLSILSSKPATISPEEAFQRSCAAAYRGTNGIFYILKKEQHALNAATFSIIYAKYMKKFAFIGRTEQTRKVFDLLVVDIDLAMEKIHFTCIKNRKAQHLHMNIEVDIDHFTFHFLYEPSGVVALFAKVTAAVCNRMYNRTENKQTNGAFSSVQHITTPKQTKGDIQVATTKKEQKLAVLKWNNQPAKQSSQHSVYRGYKMSPAPKEKKSYIRRAHWQSYWYGARNSPDRCKRLRWVEATIVNRDAAENILITL